MSVTFGTHARITQSEYDALREAAEANGQGHWMPRTIKEYGDLLQAQVSAEGSLLLDIMFGEVLHGDRSACDAWERREIPLKRVLGVTSEELEEMIERKRARDTPKDPDPGDDQGGA